MKFLHFVLLMAFAFFESHGVPITEALDCTIRHLKEKKLLDENYPTSSNNDSNVCLSVVTFALKIMEEATEEKITDNDKKDCIMQELRNAQLLEHVMKKDVLERATHIEKSKQQTQIKAEKGKLISILGETAKTCNSDPTYGGVFDDILGSTNTTLAVKQRNYCVLKYVLDNKFIETQANININPDNISTNVDCNPIIEQEKTKKRNEMRTAIEKRVELESGLQCILKKYDELNVFDTYIAGEVLETLDIPVEDKIRNRDQLFNPILRFTTATVGCVMSF